METNQSWLEYLGRSKKGQWIKSVRHEDDRIDIYWKRRFDCDKDFVIYYDFNGDIESKMHASRVDWGEEWVFAGSIKLVDEMVDLCGIENFDKFVYGIMRHVVCLLICGYGESAEEVIGWFDNFEEYGFVVDGRYKIIGSHGDIQDLEGGFINILPDSGSIIEVNGAEFELDLMDDSIFTSFMIVSQPV